MEPVIIMDIDICICTYRRAHVAETLRSLARLMLKPDWKIRVIVADNNDAPNARELVETTAHECSLTLTYLHAPARNISVARNACLDAATAPLIAFIDDDEIASPAWLDALAATLQSSKADVVLGPVQAVYGPACSAWMRGGRFSFGQAGMGWRRNQDRLHMQRSYAAHGPCVSGLAFSPGARPHRRRGYGFLCRPAPRRRKNHLRAGGHRDGSRAGHAGGFLVAAEVPFPLRPDAWLVAFGKRRHKYFYSRKEHCGRRRQDSFLPRRGVA
jgi:glycosyltransferase involved in cell wall biosynthesis